MRWLILAAAVAAFQFHWARGASASDLSAPTQSLIGRGIPALRSQLGDLVEPSKADNPSVLETNDAIIKVFDGWSLLSEPGCHAFVWPNESVTEGTAALDYYFIFSSDKLAAVAQLLNSNPFKTSRGTFYRPGPKPILSQGEHLPFENGVRAYAENLIHTGAPQNTDVKAHCDPKLYSEGPLPSRTDELLGELKPGMVVDAASYARKHQASLFETGQYYSIISVKWARSLALSKTLGPEYAFVGVRRGRVEWLATGFFAGAVGAAICQSSSTNSAGHCSSEGVYRP
jgi:hypothetical protein